MTAEAMQTYDPRIMWRGGMRMSHSRARSQPWSPRVTLIVSDEVTRKTQLAYAIRQAMDARGLTLKDVARMMDRPYVTIGRWARGQTVPSALEILPLANVLGVRPELLIDPPPIPEPVVYPLADYLLQE